MEVTNTSGRRKTSISRIYLRKGNGKITVNHKDYKSYFPTVSLQFKVQQPFSITENIDKYDVDVNVVGGGITGQAEATRLAIAKALVDLDENYRVPLKKEGLMTRDSRMVERKKPGQKKARKKFQFSKR